MPSWERLQKDNATHRRGYLSELFYLMEAVRASQQPRADL